MQAPDRDPYSSLQNGRWNALITSRQAVEGSQPLADVQNFLRDKQGEFSAVLENGKPIGLCSRGTIGFLMASKFGYSIYGKKRVKDHMISRFLKFEDGTTWEAGLALALSRGDSDFYHDVVLTDKQGDFAGLLSVQSLVKLQSHLLTDHAKRLKEHQEHVIQQERLGALGQMAAGIAHDFNNALTPILGYTELLLLNPQYLENSAKGLRYIKTMNTAAADAARVVSRLREFYRQREQSENLQSLDLNALVSEAVLLTQPSWKNQARMQARTIHFNMELSSIPSILGNPTEIREMLTNLILNAVDAMPQGGIIKFSSFAEEERVVLEISDTGQGMTEEVRRRCMEPFFTTKGARGTGLGLAMVYGIIKRHSGDVRIESEPDHGTLFSIHFPAYSGPERKILDALPAVAIGPLKILIVDDETNVLDVVATLLRQDQHTVEAASNGRDAVDKFRGSTFDLVITDRSMPEMNGDQVAWEIKRIAPSVPVIMLTGFGELMSAKGECPSGVDLVVSKPVKIDELKRALQRVVSASSQKTQNANQP